MVMVNVLWNSNLGAYHADLTINDDCEVYVDGDAMEVVVTAQRTEEINLTESMLNRPSQKELCSCSLF